MFLKYFAPLYEPIRFIRNKWVKSTTKVGKVKVDAKRVKSYKNLAKGKAKDAKSKAKQAKDKVGGARGKAQAARQLAPPGGPMPPGGGPMPPGGGPMPPAGGPPAMGGQMRPQMAQAMPGGYPVQPGGIPAANGGLGRPPGAPGAGPGGVAPVSNIVVSGSLWWKKHLCGNCGQELDKTWDVCPYCQAQAQQAAAAMAPVAHKTQAIMVDSAGAGTGMQLLGWLVAIKGPQRGELFTLAPVSSIGTDATCTVCLLDQYMSSNHAEIKAEGGAWVLRDLKSTNGTYVNDKRIEQHELLDNDFVRIGQSVLKFKSL